MRLLTLTLLCLALLAAHEVARAADIDLVALEADVDAGALDRHPENARLVAKALIAELRKQRAAPKREGWWLGDDTQPTCKIEIMWIQAAPNAPSTLLPRGKCAEVADVVLSESLTLLLQEIANGSIDRLK
jgi:hypothetical protein